MSRRIKVPQPMHVEENKQTASSVQAQKNEASLACNKSTSRNRHLCFFFMISSPVIFFNFLKKFFTPEKEK